MERAMEASREVPKGGRSPVLAKGVNLACVILFARVSEHKQHSSVAFYSK